MPDAPIMSQVTDVATPPIFVMTVDLNVLEHLGINLYSNIAAVLTEAVANAWDADANMDAHGKVRSSTRRFFCLFS
jgi:hypothetical protein